MRVLWNHILQSPKSQEELAVIDVTAMTFETINSESSSRLGFTTLGAFLSPPRMGGTFGALARKQQYLSHY